MTNLSKITLLFFPMIFSGCAFDAWIGKFDRLGESATVECWSGNQKIYSGQSTGAVKSESYSDGYFFRDKKTNQVMEVSGNCIIIYAGDKQK